MQTILGSGGAIGNELAKALSAYTKSIKLVSRKPEKVNEDDLLHAADLEDPEATMEAVAGSEVVYLTVGLPYDTKLWKSSWPVIMKNVINACLAHHCKLVFFDNIYLYDSTSLDPIKEDHRVHPCSRKGKVRSKLARMVWDAVEKDGLEAQITRSADFYGPGVKSTGILRETIIKPLSNGGTANLLGSDQYQHSFTYTPDAAKATALLGNTPDAYGEVWHLPTAPNPPTGKEWVEVVARALKVKPKYRVINKFLARIIGLFIPEIRESVEMFYQYDRNYVFDSSKFEKHFSLKPTPYDVGIKEVIKTDYKIGL